MRVGVGVWVLLAPATAWADTLLVPRDHLTLAQAVEAASDGDRIEVASTYMPVEVYVEVAKDLTIVGTGGTASLPALHVNEAEVSLESVSFTRQVGVVVKQLDGSTEDTFSMLLGTGGSITLKNASFSAGAGSGIIGSGSTLSLDDVDLAGFAGVAVRVTSSAFTMNGGSIRSSAGGLNGSAGTYSLTGATFADNTRAAPGAHVLLLGDVDATIDTCTFERGSSVGSVGSAIAALPRDGGDSATVSITKSTFSGNLSTYEGGATIYAEDTALTLDDVDVELVAGAGRALWTVRSDVVVHNAKLVGDALDLASATNPAGGTMALAQGSLEVVGSELYTGVASFGGAVYLFEVNPATFDTVDVFVGPRDTGGTPYGGGFAASGGHLTLDDVRFHQISAVNGGGAVFQSDGVIDVVGSKFLGPATAQWGTGLALAMGATATVSDTSFAGLDAELGGAGAAVTEGASLTFLGGELTGLHAGNGGAVAIYGSSAEIDGARIDLATADPEVGLGGAVFVDAGELTLRNVSVVGSSSAQALSGGAVAALSSSLVEFDHVTLTGFAVPGYGGAVLVQASELSATALHVSGSSAQKGGLISVIDGAMAIEGGTLTGGRASLGGAVESYRSHLSLTDVVLVDNEAGAGGGVYATEGSVAELVRGWWCDNRATTAGGGAALDLDVVAGGSAAVRGNAFVGNRGAGPAMRIGRGGTEATYDLVNNTFALNRGQGGHVAVEGSGHAIVNNILAWSTIGLDAPGTGVGADVHHNLWWQLDVPSLGTTLEAGTGAVRAGPMFHDLRVGEDVCDSNLYLGRDSPARRAGDPAIRAFDGGRSDIGAFGGPDARIPDADGDGWTADLDCDDSDPTVHPGADDADKDCDDSVLWVLGGACSSAPSGFAAWPLLLPLLWRRRRS